MTQGTVKYQRVELTAAQRPEGPQADQVRAL
jgi:cold shock CspA family protein